MLKLSKHNSCISIDELNRLNKERCDKLRYEYYMRSVHKICGNVVYWLMIELSLFVKLVVISRLFGNLWTLIN